MKKKLALKWGIYVLLFSVCMLIQDYGLSHLRIFGVAPQFAGAFAAIVAVFEGPVGGMLFGMFAGFTRDSLHLYGTGFFAMMYLLMGCVAGVACVQFFRKSFLVAMLLALISVAVSVLGYFFLFFWIPGRATIEALWLKALPEIAYSMLFAPLFYPLIRKISVRFAVEKSLD